VIDAKREPLPIGAIFEAAFRRFGAHFAGYMLWSFGFGMVAVAIAAAARALTSGRLTFALLFAGVLLSHFLLAGCLTALVTGTLRGEAVSLTIAAFLASVVIFAGALFVGPLIGILYPVLVFPPIAAAAGDASPLAAFPAGARLALRDWGRTYAALCGLGLFVFFIWIGFAVALTPVLSTSGQIAVIVIVVLLCSPIAALVERSLYGDVTGRTVIPADVSRERTPIRRPK
jgi:hypothetical protein